MKANLARNAAGMQPSLGSSDSNGKLLSCIPSSFSWSNSVHFMTQALSSEVKEHAEIEGKRCAESNQCQDLMSI